MATTWNADPQNDIVDRDSQIRSTLVNHLLTISKMGFAIDQLPDSNILKERLAYSLSMLGVPQDFLAQISGKVDQDIELLQKIDVAPVVSFAILKSVRKLIDQKKFENARNLLTPLVQRSPQHAEAHYLLGRTLAGLWEFDLAEQVYEKAIALDTRRLESYSGLATLYERTKKYDLADKTWRRGFQFGAIYKRTYLGKNKNPIRILVISSVLAGNIRFMRFLDPHEFEITSVIAEAYTPYLILPEHDIVFQAIGDTELCVRAVDIAPAILARVKAPVINNPLAIAKTGREENSVRLRQIENVVTPLTLTISRKILAADDADAYLRAQGFTYPMLMRSTGYFNGSYFEKIESPEDISRIVASLPGDDLIVIQYIDTTRNDGTIRKYRMMGIDKKLYPIHLAISYNWKIHYFSANMRDKQEFRDEEYAYLYEPENVLGPKVMKALADIVEMLGLDYCGIDFTIDAEGRVIVFEANATMALLLPDESPEWNYRRQPIQNALDAARELVLSRLPKKRALLALDNAIKNCALPKPKSTSRVKKKAKKKGNRKSVNARRR